MWHVLPQQACYYTMERWWVGRITSRQNYTMLYGNTQQIDPFTSYKKKLAQYSLYGHYGRGDAERRCQRKRKK